ncbi:IS1182 family transposase [Sinobaca sp. H24]|uniref:IS1182 family transposase n=1 Tax=Sinobaca sp. H24 TaxID=2923376 RepID=UPI0035AF2E24
MLGKAKNHRRDQVTVSVEELVPADHFLRTIDTMIDFQFIEEKLAAYYSPTIGRPSIPPITLFKMMFIGYFYGIRSERQLEKELQTNVAYRWFLGLSLTDRIPDHSTISWNRQTRFLDTTVFEDIFNAIVHQAEGHGLVDGRILVSDSTHVKANANKNKFLRKAKSPKVPAYLAELEAEVQADREKEGKKRSDPKERKPADPAMTRISRTDPDSGFMMRDGKPQGFFYLDHRTVDAKYNIITDTYITPGNVHDADPYLDRLEVQRATFDFPVEAVALDAGYFTGYLCKKLEEQGIYAVMGYRRYGKSRRYLPKRKFRYIASKKAYVCPMGCMLTYRLTDREGYRQYRSRPQDCQGCPMRETCFSPAASSRLISRLIWEDGKDRARARKRTKTGKALYHLRSQTIERSFGDAKELHGFRYTRYRGHPSVQAQAHLTAACQNMKKIALYLAKRSA